MCKWYEDVYKVLEDNVEESFNVSRLFMLFNSGDCNAYKEYKIELSKFDGLTEEQLNEFISEYELIKGESRKELMSYLYDVMNRAKCLSLTNKVNRLVTNKDDIDYKSIMGDIREMKIGKAKKYIKSRVLIMV